jgi:hypothetical protein
MALAATQAQAQYRYYNHHLQLDGVGDYVEIPAGTAPNFGPQLTVEAWIQTNVPVGDQAIIARYNNNSNSNFDDSFQLTVHQGRLRFQIAPGNAFFILDGARSIADGRWHHVAGIYNGNTMQIMVDGALDGTRQAAGLLNNPAGTKLRIGAAYDNGAAGFFFSGLIDEAHLYEYAIPLGEIAFNRVLPVRDASGSYRLRTTWRFNKFPDTGFNPAFVGNAVEVPDTSLTRPYGPLSNDSCLQLDFGEYLHVLNGQNLAPTTAVTVEAWIRTSSQRGTLQTIVSKYRSNSGSDADDGYLLAIEPFGVARFQISNGSNFHILTGNGDLRDGQWHHVAGTYDGQWLRLYVDGVLQASGPLAGPMPSNATPLYIGAMPEGANGVMSHYFEGRIDDVRIWSVARTQAQIQGFSNSCWFNLPVTLKGRWIFEGDFLSLVQLRTPNPGLHKGMPRGNPERIRFEPVNRYLCP